MGDMEARGRPRMIAIEAVVTRADGTVEDLGIVSYWHRNPLFRLAWRIGQLMKGARRG